MDTEIELRHLRYFVAVAEELHFGRAALRLHLAQPPLSQQIRRLEEILGYPLFARTSRSVSLTPTGAVFLERARRTLRSVERDLDEARSVGRGEEGTMHIGFVGSAMLASLPAILRRYRQTYPGVRLHLHESFTSKVLEGLQSGALDAGLLRDGDPTPGVEAIPIYSEPFVAVLPAQHPLAGRKIISANSLRNEPFVYYPTSAGTRAFDLPFRLFSGDAEQAFRPRIVQEGTHWLTILRLIGAGLGVSIAPDCVRHIASPELVCIPIRQPKDTARVFSSIELATRSSEARPIVARFTQMMLASARNPSTR